MSGTSPVTTIASPPSRNAPTPKSHGEVWALPWQARAEGDDLLLAVHGVRFPYTLRKRLALSSAGLSIDYALNNPTPFVLKWVFSAHPLFAVTATTELEFPGAPHLRVDSSVGGVLGERGDRYTWPHARGLDLRRLDPGAGRGDKLFAGPLAAGRARLVDRATGDWVGFEWDTSQLPLCGLWIDQGGWPSDEPCFNVALEPCNGYPDPLDQAIAGKEHGAVEGYGTASWRLFLNAGA